MNSSKTNFQGDISSLKLHDQASDDVAGLNYGHFVKDDTNLDEEQLANSDGLLPNTIEWQTSHQESDINDVTGAQLIAAFVKRLPNKAGVYRMFNKSGDVLYVGKARNLKKRVANYTRPTGHSNRISRMINATCNMEFVITQTETEALLLEANLIKRLRPHYNILLRDDKSFPYIVLTKNHKMPGLFKHRGARSQKGDYFGPFASAGAVNHTINSLQRAFLLRTCTDSVFETRTRPCLLYQIKRCSGPCTHEISDSDYALLVKEAKDFLSGKSQLIKEEMLQSMQKASQHLDFEHAAVYRDRLAALAHIQGHQGVNPQGVEEADVFAVHFEGGQSCIQVFFFRTGQNWGNRAYFPKADPSISTKEILSAFIAQFYDDKPIPSLILISEDIEEKDLLTKALCLKAKQKISIILPQRGEKKELVNHAIINAREALGRRLAETTTQAKLLQGFAETFKLAHTPKRIEVYDNSHIMGTNAVGAMIVAGPEGFVKNQYRKFNIKSQDITPGDDYAMMREVMERRLSHLVKQKDFPAPDANQDNDYFPLWPDVILIDGGQGQMSVVHEVLHKLQLNDVIVAIGIAKGMDREAGRERFFVEGKPSFTLPPRDAVLYFIQRLRDEAHRFAIGTHRAKRKKAMFKSSLDEIEGIGPARKRALLQHFGTVKAVSRAAIEDLMRVEGISQAIAKTINDHFNEK